jgi:acetyl esterase/lipase
MTTLTRRDLLVATGALAASAALGACTSSTARPAQMPASEDRRTLRYGEGESQFAHLYLPATAPDGGPARPGGRLAVVALIHGGFWQQGYDLSLMDDLVRDLVARGWAVLNIEYRRVGEDGGGWPGTFEDVGAAIDLIATTDGTLLDPERVVTVGHSAGGHLALWAAARAGLPAGAPGAEPAVQPAGAIGQAPVADLVACAEADLGVGACQQLLGGSPAEVPERYNLGSPASRLPIGVPQVLIHGTVDDRVPVDQSRGYTAAADAAGDDVTLVEIDGADHFTHLNPISASWLAAIDALHTLVP